jgi:prepilin-type N-terminal cleavage/methylation domain-containing protein
MKLKNTQKMKGFTLVELLVVIAIIAVLAGIATPLILKAQKAGDRTKALANSKSVVGGLLSFKSDKGAYPCRSTRELLEDDGIDILPQGTDANAYLAQLVATDNIDTEKAFFAPGVLGAKEGDNILGEAGEGKLLARGENSFAYIMAEDEAPLTDTKSYTPLVIAPIKSGGDDPKFDGGPYGDKYVYGLVDGSSSAGDIAEDGTAKSAGRESFFQAGRDSLFGNDKPVVKLPTGIQ